MSRLANARAGRHVRILRRISSSPSRLLSLSSPGCFMRTSTALVLSSAAAAIVAIGCSTTQAPAPASGPRTAATQPATNPQQHQQPTAGVPRTPADSTAEPGAGGGGAGRGGRGGAGGGNQAGAANPQPYNRVVTAQAQTKQGLFKTHRIGERLLFELPRRELNKDILLVQEIAQTTLGAGYGGQAAGNRVLRFERKDNRIIMRGISYEVVSSDSTTPVAGAVAASNVHPILAIFNVESYGPDSAAVIDVSRIFTQPPAEFSPASRIGTGYTVDATRSWVERTSAFPDNVNVYSTLTLQNANAGRGGGGGGAPPGRRG